MAGLPVDLSHPELLLPLLAGMWIGIMVLIARFTGWSALADVYRERDVFTGKRWRFQSARMRWGGSYGYIT